MLHADVFERQKQKATQAPIKIEPKQTGIVIRASVETLLRELLLEQPERVFSGVRHDTETQNERHLADHEAIGMLHSSPFSSTLRMNFISSLRHRLAAK